MGPGEDRVVSRLDPQGPQGHRRRLPPARPFERGRGGARRTAGLRDRFVARRQRQSGLRLRPLRFGRGQDGRYRRSLRFLRPCRESGRRSLPLGNLARPKDQGPRGIDRRLYTGRPQLRHHRGSLQGHPARLVGLCLHPRQVGGYRISPSPAAHLRQPQDRADPRPPRPQGRLPHLRRRRPPDPLYREILGSDGLDHRGRLLPLRAPGRLPARDLHLHPARHPLLHGLGLRLVLRLRTHLPSDRGAAPI